MASSPAGHRKSADTMRHICIYRNQAKNHSGNKFTCVQSESAYGFSSVVVEVVGLGLHPGIVCITGVVHIASVNLKPHQIPVTHKTMKELCSFRALCRQVSILYTLCLELSYLAYSGALVVLREWMLKTDALM